MLTLGESTFVNGKGEQIISKCLICQSKKKVKGWNEFTEKNIQEN